VYFRQERENVKWISPPMHFSGENVKFSITQMQQICL
jgi:hypothetical protein